MPHNYSRPKTYPNPSFLAASTIPPVLPPSVEEAYRRKCIQLRSRTQTVSDANDAARIRLLRMRRGIEKMRLERAFLLEQVARRVKPNDDSSDGSPSPPPTPKQKPLRVKRGRRGPDFMAHELPQNSQHNQNHKSQSQDDSFSQSRIDPHGDALERDRPEHTARHTNPDQQVPPYELDISSIGHNLRPRNGFEVFAQDLFGPMSVNYRREIAKGEFDVRAEIVKRWRETPYEGKVVWDRRYRNGEFNEPVLGLDENAQSFTERGGGNGEEGRSEADEGRSPERLDVEMGDEDEERD